MVSKEPLTRQKMLKPLPSLLANKASVRKASFTQENFSQDKREGGSKGERERESDLLATAKAEGTRVKDGNGWF